MSKVTEAIHNHHEKLLKALAARASVLAGAPWEANARALADFLKDDLLPHAEGEERDLYPLVGRLIKAHGEGTETMRVDHEFIRKYAAEIDSVAGALGAAKPAESPALASRLQRLAIELQAVLQLHLEKEERVYLPLLERHSTAEQQQRALDGMHSAYRERKGKAKTSDAPAQFKTLDVRELVPAKRHSLIFETFENLGPGQAFILVNDHDPKPLYYQFRAEREGQFSWDYIEQGPEVWRVRITRTRSSQPGLSH